jgi:hypothetical protein
VQVVSTSSLAPVSPPVVVDPRTASRHTSGSLAQQRPLPLPPTHISRDSSVGYALATLDCHGRVADRKIMVALGWSTTTALTIRQQQGLIVVGADQYGAFRLTARLFLHLPVAVRGWCGLHSGDRVLLVARPQVHQILLARLNAANRIDWTRTAMDGSHIDAKKGVPEPARRRSTAANPVRNTTCSATATAPRSTC